MMRSLYAVYRKEMSHYFVSPIAAMEEAIQAQMQGAQFGAPPALDVPSEVVRAFLGLLALVFLFFLPMLTMGVYAEEKKRGTMELLMTSPITELDIVLGKFFASLTLFIAMLLPTAAYVTFIWMHSDP